jgi:integrase/recombinase XerD
VQNADLIIVPGEKTLAEAVSGLPALVRRAGKPAVAAWKDFFDGKLANSNTRIAYARAVRQFLDWCEAQGLELPRVMAGDVGRYLREHSGCLSTKKQHLAALRRYFNLLVERHIVLINPAAVAETERCQVVEGKTPEITVDQARRLLASINASTVVGLRDRAILCVLIYTAARAGAAARLRLQDFYQAGGQYCLRFLEKGGKSREIPVRHDLEGYIRDYIQAAGLENAPKASPLFRTAVRKENRLTETAMTGFDVYRMVKRRLQQAGLPGILSPHSFRVATATDLLEQRIPLEEVQYLLGHADPRTTRLYDRREKRVTRNIVERISI